MSLANKITRTISPPLSELHKLRPQLTAGEREVIDFFDRNLPIAWEIYVQPYLNGLRPDIVLLHPRVGIAVFEIKDWQLSAMHYYVRIDDNKQPQLMATKKDGTTFPIKGNPVKQVQLYKNEIIDLYCPRLNARYAKATVTAGVIMTRTPQHQVDALFEPFTCTNPFPQYAPVVGKETLENDELHSVFPEASRRYSRYMNDDLATDLRHWLVEPDFASERRIPIALSQQQQRLINDRTDTGFRRIRGAAGSGKSLILAARAAELANAGKRVLVISFNITLLHYLRGLASHYAHTTDMGKQKIPFMNFHYWCKRICIEYGYEYAYSALWPKQEKNSSDNSQSIIINELPDLVARIIEVEKDAGTFQHYDAILVDEGQDFHLHWWQTLRSALAPNGEMLLVQDTTQDIYQTAHAWTEQAMKNCGFRGKWVELEGSYRLPAALMPLMKTFVEQYLPEGANIPVPPPQMELMLHPCGLKWLQVSPHKAREACLNELLQGVLINAPDKAKLSISDVVFLSSNQDFGYKVVTDLGQNGIKTAHTYGCNTVEKRRLKQRFFMASKTIKATTLHSFKGWEARALVIYLDEKINPKAFPLVYTGLTRLKRHTRWSSLTVICASKALREFGEQWENYQEIN